MTLPVPKLDDRTFEDLVEEAIQKIPTLCPQWTDFNPSDPGITLIELMAWMTETILYRLNRVPEKNYIKFLELMGVRLKPAQPSRSWVVFKVADRAHEEALPQIAAGTRLSTKAENGESVKFETCDPLNLTSAHIIRVCSKYREDFTDHTSQWMKEGIHPVKIFCGETHVPHVLYLGDARLGRFAKESLLRMSVEMATKLSRGVYVEWECWDGSAWEPLIPVQDGTRGFMKSGEIVLDSLSNIAERDINGISSHWIRARLIGADPEILPGIAALKRSIELKHGYGLVPEKAYVSTETIPYQPVEFGREFYPFGKEPQPGNIFYLGSWLFSRKDARISLAITMSERYMPLGQKLLSGLEVCWEYYGESGNWEFLGITGPNGIIRSEHAFTDQTEALTQSGIVSFHCPHDVAEFSNYGEPGWYIRARLARGSYGTEEVSPPIVSSLLINFAEQPENWQNYVAENYFSCQDLTPLVAAGEPIEPFFISPEKSPALYLAFDTLLSNSAHRVYFQLAEQAEPASARMASEYWSRDGWKSLHVLQDGTRAFSRKGALEFVSPADWHKAGMFQVEGYWLRVRWETGAYGECPELMGVYLNAVEAVGATGNRHEVLGSSNQEPFQKFSFNRAPILPGPSIIIREADGPSPEEITSLKEQFENDVIEDIDATGKVISLWVRWKEVMNFFKSGPGDRHFCVDLYKGSVTFGDGKRGMVPPIGSDNVKAEVYYMGGGTNGNVGRNSITVLESAYPYVEAVTNIEPAEGGADPETIEEAKIRGPWTIKHRYRAVTKEDFEQLARETSSEVALAKCFTDNGEIKVVILPKRDTERPRPTYGLIQKIAQYLDERRLITTKLKVVGPEYEGIVINVHVILTSLYVGRFPEMKGPMEGELKNFLHPLQGGPKGQGWPMGRTVHVSELYGLLEMVEGVDYVEKIRMKRWNTDQWVEKIKIGSRAFPYFCEIQIKQV